MNDAELDFVIEKYISGFWPKKYGKENAGDIGMFRRVLGRYSEKVAIEAIMNWKEDNKFAPAVSEVKTECEKLCPRKSYVKTPHFVRNEKTGWFTQIICPSYQEERARDIAFQIKDRLAIRDGDGNIIRNDHEVYLDTTVRAMINMRPKYSPKTMKQAIRSTTPSRKPTHNELQQRKNEMVKELVD